MISKVILLFSLFSIISPILAVTYNKCSMAKLLLSYGVSRSQLENWVCLIESESSYRTHVIGRSDFDGSYVWGLFQIKDKYWCRGYYSNSPNACGVNCNELLTANIYKALSCAIKIYNIHGYYAWDGWKQNCNGRSFSLNDCGDLRSYIRRY